MFLRVDRDYTFFWSPATASNMLASKMLTFFLKGSSCQNTCFLDKAACCVIDLSVSQVFDVVCITSFSK